jgi:histidinol-phosphate aminotransferase
MMATASDTRAVLDVQSLARADVRALPLYAVDRTARAIDVSDNVNLWGTPPAVRRALADAPVETASRYPSLYSIPLRDAVLGYVGLGSGAAGGVGVVTGCGSDDVLDAAMRAFGDPGDRIAFAEPTFSMIPIFARLNGLEPVAIPMTPTFDLDPQRLVDCRAKITYLCSPNNPTSTMLSRATVEYVVEHAAGLVILDEAYAEFAPESFVALVARHERLLVTRTLSKAFGLAGLRVGFGVASEPVIELLTRARGPYKVNVFAEIAALAALREGADGGLAWVREHVALAVHVRACLADAVRALGLEPLPSSANFLCIPTPDARDIARAMRARGVLVGVHTGLARDVPVLDAAGGQALRIGVGPWDVMETVLSTLAEARRCA